jgi:hypothetical protein
MGNLHAFSTASPNKEKRSWWVQELGEGVGKKLGESVERGMANGDL